MVALDQSSRSIDDENCFDSIGKAKKISWETGYGV